MWSRFFLTPSLSWLQKRQILSDSSVVLVGTSYDKSLSSGTESGSFELESDLLMSLMKSDDSV